jgi:hypothetical protein
MPETKAPSASTNTGQLPLVVLAGLSTVCYLCVGSLSRTFGETTSPDQQMTLAVLAALGAAFALYWLAIFVATRSRPSHALLGVIVGGACLFRAVLLTSTPIHEIDIYRYLWDGAVVVEGVSPYRYSPQQVLDAARQEPGSLETDLEKLTKLRERSGSLGDSLERIHYGHLTSPYPPVSQAVFALSAWLTPDEASLHSRLVLMKGLLVLFDLATLLLVIALLHEVGMHPGWSVAYGWCPLLMKEFANGGHLDSIAMFLTTLAMLLLVKTTMSRTGTKSWGALVTGTVLALAIGAKLYPVVLVPLAAALWWKQGGLRTAVIGLFATVVVAAGTLSPMLGPSDGISNKSDQASAAPAEGLRAFLSEWEMNDLLFMIVRENLRPRAEKPTHERPWFVIVPDSWSRALLSIAVGDTPQAFKPASFLLARAITGGMFLVVAVWLAWRAGGQEDGQHWCRAAMLTLAWFWLLCPTQNPWYWCWVLPLIPFARCRVWYVMGACVLFYYLRFWLTAHYGSPPVLGTKYDGAHFFDFVVVWLEFAPCLLALAVEWHYYRPKAGEPTAAAMNLASSEFSTV